jgi:hypothetical protein
MCMSLHWLSSDVVRCFSFRLFTAYCMTGRIWSNMSTAYGFACRNSSSCRYDENGDILKRRTLGCRLTHGNYSWDVHYVTKALCKADIWLLKGLHMLYRYGRSSPKERKSAILPAKWFLLCF